MPVPTADLYDQQQETQPQTNGTHPSNPAAHSTQQSNGSYFVTESGSSASASTNGAGRALTKEEADRLYEERMEEEYAKRDGGA
ncbi:uncharacterized protein N7529_004050 [Penicillium soppii]|jgi:hypothetical protein|uniref:uncharacterized protein n=1 Tax=Penicillium soppii TaxID=69789 RepID=UPI0025477E2F|nr:uncharacterized protein N7529_004050 [Penicillium soppii]KAJ5871697.1 hypothetical protein N7529_004050 [Penicillium soppii]